MAYEKQTWNNDDPETPLSAARMGHIEDGIAGADSAATQAKSAADSAQSAADAAQTAADGAAPAEHTHSMDDVEGLSSALAGKANSSSLSAKADQSALEALEARVAALEPEA